VYPCLTVRHPCLTVRHLSADAVLGQMAEARVRTERPAVREGSSSAKAAPARRGGRNPDDLSFDSGRRTLEPALSLATTPMGQPAHH
jgi:hypothetical protein